MFPCRKSSMVPIRVDISRLPLKDIDFPYYYRLDLS